MKNKDTHPTAGATERTPSKPQFFAWVNSTNEGSTEAQTLANLEYFAFLRRKYNMHLEIYAWDAGNLDGSVETYETFDSPKFRAQYPNGYGPIADAAAKIGCRLGVWCGPDGFGDTPESQAARHEQMVALCRDFHFAQLKIDGVCGQLREDHRDLFVKMMTEARKYSPDLILLNHRLWLGEEGMKHSTTFLWHGNEPGDEMYTDVHMYNRLTAPHHRAYFMRRGNTPSLLRLAEDHGVCISSCIDYFEDDLIWQAFGRCLILAPEIYGNPWLMRDDEHAHLARIFNLHRRFRDILVTGMLLPGGGHYPHDSVARGTPSRRFITTGWDEWDMGHIRMTLDMEIGLAPCDKVSVIIHHPHEKFVGEFDYGDVCEIPLLPFRAALIEVVDSREADVMLAGCEYDVLHESDDGVIDRIKIVSSTGNVHYTDGRAFRDIPAFDNTLRAPIDLGSIKGNEFSDVPADAEKQLETALFVQDQDSLESKSLKRAGETAIPEVKAARDAFFAQRTYELRGCECKNAFDGDPDTIFDGTTKQFFVPQGYRIDGGCLRVDFGDVYDADFVSVSFFDPAEKITHHYKGTHWDFTIPYQKIPPCGDFSTDLGEWTPTYLDSIENGAEEIREYLVHNTHNIISGKARRRTVTYPVRGAIRYLRLPCPPDNIFDISLIKDGERVALTSPRANNILPYKRKVEYAKEMTVRVDPADWREGCYLAIGLEGDHGCEGAYAILDTDGEYIGAFDRAPGYQSNIWEAQVHSVGEYYTYYFKVTPEMCGRDLTVRVLGIDDEQKDYAVTAHLCDENRELEGIECDL